MRLAFFSHRATRSIGRCPLAMPFDVERSPVRRPSRVPCRSSGTCVQKALSSSKSFKRQIHVARNGCFSRCYQNAELASRLHVQTPFARGKSHRAYFNGPPPNGRREPNSSRRHPRPPHGDPVDVLHFAIESMCKSQAELANLIGRNRASEILNRVRPLTLIHTICKEWSIPH